MYLKKFAFYKDKLYAKVQKPPGLGEFISKKGTNPLFSGEFFVPQHHVVVILAHRPQAAFATFGTAGNTDVTAV